MCRKCRILCLTDGDNSDNVDPVEVAQFCIVGIYITCIVCNSLLLPIDINVAG